MKGFLLNHYSIRNMYISLAFKLEKPILPSREEHFGTLQRIAQLFEPFGLPMDVWHPPAPTRKKSLAHAAFDRNGPTPAALELQRLQDEKDGMTDYRRTGIWSGSEKGKRGVLSVSFSSSTRFPICLFDLQFDEIEPLDDARNMQQLIFGLLDICPRASDIEVGPFKYYTLHRVFPKRPGAGWMLYLPTAITSEAVPEAAELVPVTESGRQTGTIIVSVADDVFSADNPDHVKIANAIEIRLADQDLLPR
ncbi:Imm52 family immunity protein [Trinickia sp. Y13]|uniref:Imm52 family immunity protein n=1 Tax=Trinickia sp. Y13 TaxID=2917807 RepID=UPI002407427D|nr:Imm52 family immunity protein [Trinickia sp. Y13]MDG0024725.1 immunity 52 family protein [Trinickia sp. Y13]